MMTKPTVAELLEKVDNRYSLVIATAKRARQIASGDEELVSTEDVAPVTIAADEIGAGKVKVETENVVNSENIATIDENEDESVNEQISDDEEDIKEEIIEE